MAASTNTIRTLPRAADHLGTLANILKDLGGGATLLNELTQNADDSRAAELRFTATARELVVHNTAVFSNCGDQPAPVCPWKVEGRRACDLHSFRQVAGRNKEDDFSVTGAYGVGFTAVYQVTDHPELVTGGLHWILDELQPEHARVQVCSGGCERDHDAAGTSFFLPWVQGTTELRRALGQAALTDSDVELLIEQMHEAAPAALVFLEHLEKLDVRSLGQHTTVERLRQDDRVTVTVNGSPAEWLLLEGAAAGADELKERHDREDDKRSPVVQVAVPVTGETIGRVYASLPTETRTGWSGHINGSFVPKQDRKTVEFGSRGFRGEWNDLLIDTAARVAAENLETIADALGDKVAWEYLVAAEQINRDIARDEYPAPFAALFVHAKLAAVDSPIALLVDGQRVPPSGVLVPRDDDEYLAAGALTKLDLWLLHSSIRPEARQISRTQYGMSDLAVDDVVDAITSAGITEPWAPGDDALLTEEDVEALLRLLESLRSRGKTLLTDALAGEVAIVPCIDGTFAPADDVANLPDDDQALFELLAPDMKILDRERLERLCPSLIELCDDVTPSRAVEIFEADVDALAVAPAEVLDWLADHRSALATDEVRARVRALPIYPSTSGRCLPLTDLSLPSDFDDVLGVADVVDRDKAAGHGDLLRLLGARELDAVEYLERHVVPAARDGEISDAQAAAVLQIIDRHRVDVAQSATTREALSAAPLVATDQGLNPAREVHLPNPALALIDPDSPTAAVDGLPAHLVDTLVWLGVSSTPNNGVLSAAATRLGQEPSPPARDVVLAILDSLPNPPETDNVPTSLSALVSSPWLPVAGGGRARPREAYAVFQRYLFESQGPHLDLPRVDQQRLNQVLDWLGVPSTPTTTMVVSHLRHCAESGTEVNEQVYRFLGETRDERAVQNLRSVACVQIGRGEFVDPDTVFWADPHLGKWAHHLPLSHRQFQAFYDRVGVGESPSPVQLERILRRISREIGNDFVEDDDKAVVHRCWELLDQHLPASREALARLGSVKTALGPRDLLEKPELLLFVDGRRRAEKTPLIRDNLIHRDRSTRRALTAAGVRAAEEVIEAHVNEELPHSAAVAIESLLQDRTNALLRLVDAQRAEDAEFDLGSLRDLRIDHMPGLAVQYVTRFIGRHYVDEPRPEEAIYLHDDHRLVVSTQEPTRHLARELALCIAPEADVSTLAPSILEILSAESLADAMGVLDEYGVRDLDVTAWEVVESGSADDLTENIEAVEDDLDEAASMISGPGPSAGADVPAGQESNEAGDEAPTSNDDSVGRKREPRRQGSGASSGDGATAAARERPRQPRSDRVRVPNTSRLTSYVSFGDPEREPGGGDEAERNSSIDRAGVKRVLEYEKNCGRFPEEQHHSNPGFDVISANADGVELRRIEIKSIGGPWTDRGVLLSSTQFVDAQANPDLYWLYVVEHAEDDDAAVIHRIRNPAGHVTKFGFDSGWQALDEPEIPRDETGRTAVRATRGLLDWGSSGGAPQAGDAQPESASAPPRRNPGTARNI